MVKPTFAKLLTWPPGLMRLKTWLYLQAAHQLTSSLGKGKTHRHPPSIGLGWKWYIRLRFDGLFGQIGYQLQWNGILSFTFHFNCYRCSLGDIYSGSTHNTSIQFNAWASGTVLETCKSHRLPLQETHVNQNQWRQWTARLGQMFLCVLTFHV